MDKQLTQTFKIKIINSYEEYDEPQIVYFTSHDARSVETLIAAYSSHYSGDPIEVFIDDEKAVTHLDWGLVPPKDGERR